MAEGIDGGAGVPWLVLFQERGGINRVSVVYRTHVYGWRLGDLGLKTQVSLGQNKAIMPYCNGIQTKPGPAICEAAASVSISACKLVHSHRSAAHTQRPVRYQLRRCVCVCIACVVAKSAYRHVPAEGGLIAVEMGPYMRRPM